jgi:hypothetical protein
MGDILLRMLGRWWLSDHQCRQVRAPRTQVPVDWVIELSFASEGIFCLAVRYDVMGNQQQPVESGAYSAQE